MEDVILFKKLLSDIVELKEGQTSYEIFGNQPRAKSTQRLNSLSEQELVKLILSKPDQRELLLEDAMNIGRKEYDVFTEIQHSIVHPNERPGDVDMIAIPIADPKQSVAFEVKKVKVTVHENGSETVNRDNQIELKGIDQANGLLKKGFHKVYLVILLVTDAQYKTGKSMPFRYGDQIHQLYKSQRYSGLHQNVGVILVEMTEPTEASFNFTFSYGVNHYKDAQGQEQPAELTEKLIALRSVAEKF